MANSTTVQLRHPAKGVSDIQVSPQRARVLIKNGWKEVTSSTDKPAAPSARTNAADAAKEG